MGVPVNPIIACGSGPSLNKVPFDRIGLPYAAISTAIKFTPAPRHWLLVDRVNNAHTRIPNNPLHRGQGGAKGLGDVSIEKVVPATRGRFFDTKLNCTHVKRLRQTTFLGGSQQNMSYTLNRSMIFGVEWLSYQYDCVIFAGCDLRINPDKETFRTTRKVRSRINSRNQAMRMEYDRWVGFAKIAEEKGVLWLNWTPGSPLGEIMEDFDDWRSRHQGSGTADWVSSHLQPNGQSA